MARKRAKRKVAASRGFFRKTLAAVFPIFSLLVLVLVTASLALVAGTALFLSRGNLPKLTTLREYRPPLVTRVYSTDNTVIGEFFVEKRLWVPYAKIPKQMVHAFVAAEDASFFQHRGIDLRGIVRAAWKNIQAGGFVQGGSTITQQVAKIILLTPERSLARKLKEIITALRIERNFTKEEILELYLNQIYLGHGAYGVTQATQTYFGKGLDELNLAEIALLAGMPKAPSRYSPLRHPNRAKTRQRYVLGRMVTVGYVTPEAAQAAEYTPLKILKRDRGLSSYASYFTEQVRRYVENKYGTDALYKGGLTIKTALNARLQRTAVQALRKGLKRLDKRRGYRGAKKRLRPKDYEAFLKRLPPVTLGPNGPALGQMVKGVVEGASRVKKTAWIRVRGYTGTANLSHSPWALKGKSFPVKKGDVVLVRIEAYGKKGRLIFSLEQEPEVQGAVLALDPRTGYVIAMVGGSDFRRSQFNRATQAVRQPGSAFKPIIYAAALDAGYTPASIIMDTPVSYQAGAPGEVWQPQNYDKEYKGPVTFRRALEESRNVATVKILDSIGVEYAIGYAKKMGITSPLYPNLSLALGASGLTLWELVRAYAAFANQGYLPQPILVTEIRDRSNRLLEKNSPKLSRVISPETAYLITSIMQGVIQEGTGRSVRSIGRPAAGKTGTTDEFVDAWFVGFTPQLLTGVWVGYDDRTPLGHGESGARAAAPIWLDFMRQAIAYQPALPFPVPKNIVISPIDRETGRPVSWGTPGTLLETFRAENAPGEGLEPIDSKVFKEELPY